MCVQAVTDSGVASFNCSGNNVCRRLCQQVSLEGSPDAWIDAEIAKTCRRRANTVENVRRCCVLKGFKRALEGEQLGTPPVPTLLDGQQEAEIIDLRLGPPPEGSAA